MKVKKKKIVPIYKNMKSQILEKPLSMKRTKNIDEQRNDTIASVMTLFRLC